MNEDFKVNCMKINVIKAKVMVIEREAERTECKIGIDSEVVE